MWKGSGGQSYTQTVDFHTGRLSEDQFGHEVKAPGGQFRFTITARAIRLVGLGIAVGRTLTVVVRPCRMRRFRIGPIEECPYRGAPELKRSQITLEQSAESVAMPNVRRGGKVEIAFTMAPFNVSTATQTFHYRAVNFGGAVFPLTRPAS